MRKLLRALFDWQSVLCTGVWDYQQNAITGQRRAVRVSGGHQPQDVMWLLKLTALAPCAWAEAKEQARARIEARAKAESAKREAAAELADLKRARDAAVMEAEVLRRLLAPFLAYAAIVREHHPGRDHDAFELVSGPVPLTMRPFRHALEMAAPPVVKIWDLGCQHRACIASIRCQHPRNCLGALPYDREEI